MHIKTSEMEMLQIGIGDYTCNWGTHICGLYGTESERDEIIFSYLKQGCIDGDLQLYSPFERTIEGFKSDFTKLYPECKDCIYDKSKFNLMNSKDLYYPDGIFDPWVMDDALEKYFKETQKNGRRNIRATAEMGWALQGIPGVNYFMAYEARLNYFIPGKPWISICMYNVTKFSGSLIMNVLKTHPYTISGGIITSNPSYVNPDIWLTENAPQFLNSNKPK